MSALINPDAYRDHLLALGYSSSQAKAYALAAAKIAEMSQADEEPNLSNLRLSLQRAGIKRVDEWLRCAMAVFNPHQI